MPMTVAQAAKSLGISVSLIRHYEKEFELSFGRTKGGQRVISDRDLENLRIIRSYRDQNIAIDEIKRQLTPSAPDIADPPQPDLNDVIGALIARQDELERIVKLQQEAIGQLAGENQQLKMLQERVQLLIEAPKEPDPKVQALAEQVAALEASQAEETRLLQKRLEDLQMAVAATPEGPSEELETLQAKLVELESEIRAHQAPAEDSRALIDLQQKLQDIESALAAKASRPSDEAIKALQRRLLDLEAAFATHDETPEGGEEGLLETLVSAIQQEAKHRRPWWRFWG